MTVFKKKIIFILLSTFLVLIIATLLLTIPQSENPIYESSLFLYRTSAASENQPIVPKITYLNDKGRNFYVCYNNILPEIAPWKTKTQQQYTCDDEVCVSFDTSCGQGETCEGYTCEDTCTNTCQNTYCENTCYQITCDWYTCNGEGSTCSDNIATCDGNITDPHTCYGYTCHYTCEGGYTCDGTEDCDGTDTNDQEPTCDGSWTCQGGNTCNAGSTCAGYYGCAPTQDGSQNCGWITSDGTTCEGGLTCEWTCGETCAGTCSGWTSCGGTCGTSTCEPNCNGNTMQSTCYQTCKYTCGDTCGATCDTQTCQSTCAYTCGEGCDPDCEECEDPEGIIYLEVDQEHEFESPCPNGGTTTWEAPGGNPWYGQGSSFSTKYSEVGDYEVTVEWEEDECDDSTEFEVKVVKTDLVIHKPKVISPSEDPIPENLEMSKGAQTFVNLDNDDNDESYDYDPKYNVNDNNVPGEDELVKLRLKLYPNTLNEGSVRLEALQGSSNIQLWHHSYKGSEYSLDEPIPLSDFEIQGDALVYELWIEGISAHTTQQETQLQMIYDKTPNHPDKVALTIVGIESIEWKGYFNSVDDYNILDDDIKWPDDLSPGSVRVFPGAREILGNVEPEPRGLVYVVVTLTVHPIEPLVIYFRSFDVDDPSANTEPIDDESNEQDNRGFPKAGYFEPYEDTTDWTFYDQSEQIPFEVTMQPGDNFRVVGNGDLDLLKDLENDDSDPNHATEQDKQRIVNKYVFGTTSRKEIREPEHYASNRVLTVWRFLHVERDTMAAPTLPQVTIVGGPATITPNVPIPGRSTIDLGINLLDDFSDLNLFEGGKIVFWSCPYGQDTFTVLESTSYPFDNDQVVIMGIPGTCASGSLFTLYDDDDLSVLGTINNPIFPDGGQVLFTAFADAYILPVYLSEYYEDVVPFDLHLNYFNIALGWGSWNNGRDLTSSARFWQAFVVGCWEYEEDEDCDPDILPTIPFDPAPDGWEAGTFGITCTAFGRAAIFLQTIADDNANMNQIDGPHVVTHEIAHTCRLHGHHVPNTIMDEDGIIMSTIDYFGPESIEIFRSIEDWN